MSKHTYGNALNDCTNVHNKIRIVYPCRNSLIKRAARNKRKKPTLKVLAYGNHDDWFFFLVLLSLKKYTENNISKRKNDSWNLLVSLREFHFSCSFFFFFFCSFAEEEYWANLSGCRTLRLVQVIRLLCNQIKYFESTQ